MKQKPFTAPQERELRANFDHSQRTGDGGHFKPVVKFFCPWGAATWLISELGPDGMMFGLCDLGHGMPELGYVHLSDLTGMRGPFGLTIERDLHFKASMSITEYAEEARASGHIAA